MSILKNELMRTYDASKVTAEGIMDIAEIVDRIVKRALRERPKGKWVGGQEYCKHLEEKTGERYVPTGFGKLIYCNQCWQANDRHSAYCPDCGSRMIGV